MDNYSSSRTSTKGHSTIQNSAPTSKSSLSSIPTSSSSPIPIAPAPPRSGNSKYSMEEIWKDICPSTLPQPSKTPSSTAALEGILFQEFLSRPSRARYHSTSHHHHQHHRHDLGGHSSFGSTDSGCFGSHSRGQPAPAASTTLSLNSRVPPSSSLSLPKDHHLDADADADLNPPTVELSILPKKRVPQNEDACHRNKRMIKNRESAARSRARKQAYTNELEIKVARLMEENAKLRRQQEKLWMESPPPVFPKKHMLCRTLTAPF